MANREPLCRTTDAALPRPESARGDRPSWVGPDHVLLVQAPHRFDILGLLLPGAADLVLRPDAFHLRRLGAARIRRPSRARGHRRVVHGVRLSGTLISAAPGRPRERPARRRRREAGAGRATAERGSAYNFASASRRRLPRSSSRGSAAAMSLYELPWYVIIGAPGSGQDDRAGQFRPAVSARAALGPGRAARRRRHAQLRLVVHATRRCSSTPPAATRHRTPTRGADSAGWAEFLALLKKYRQRRPAERRDPRDQRARSDDAGPGRPRGARRGRAPPPERAEQGTAHPAAGLRAGDQVRPGRRLHRVLRRRRAGRAATQVLGRDVPVRG